MTVVSVFKGSPADLGGMQPGDLILAVDGKDVVGASLEETVRAIKGVDGTKVKIKYYRLPANDGVDLTHAARRRPPARSGVPPPRRTSYARPSTSPWSRPRP